MCVKHILKKMKKKIKEQCNDSPNIKKRINFEKISDFQSCNALYPCVSNSYYRELIN